MFLNAMGIALVIIVIIAVFILIAMCTAISRMGKNKPPAPDDQKKDDDIKIGYCIFRNSHKKRKAPAGRQT